MFPYYKFMGTVHPSYNLFIFIVKRVENIYLGKVSERLLSKLDPEC